jgi:hypothetical protein
MAEEKKEEEIVEPAKSSRMRIGGIVLVIALIGCVAAVAWGAMPKNTPQSGSLAEYLTEQGFTLYYATHCPACQKEMEEFGDDFSKLNAIDCDLTSCKVLCDDAGIRAVPTWVHEGGGLHEGYLTLPELAAWSGYQETAMQATRKDDIENA